MSNSLEFQINRFINGLPSEKTLGLGRNELTYRHEMHNLAIIVFRLNKEVTRLQTEISKKQTEQESMESAKLPTSAREAFEKWCRESLSPRFQNCWFAALEYCYRTGQRNAEYICETEDTSDMLAVDIEKLRQICEVK